MSHDDIKLAQMLLNMVSTPDADGIYRFRLTPEGEAFVKRALAQETAAIDNWKPQV